MVSPRDPQAVATPRAHRVARRWPWVSGIALIVLALALGALITARDHGMALSIDTRWMDELMENRAPVWQFLSLVMNNLGGGVIATFLVPIALIGILLLLKRPWAAVFFFLATVLTGGAVQLFKHLFGRARPESLMVSVDFGSFPSGHVANAAAMALILSILFPKWWVWLAAAVYTATMMFSRTYLGAHWLSDTIGGLLLGIGLTLLIWAPLASRIDGERQLRRRRHDSPLASSRAGAV